MFYLTPENRDRLEWLYVDIVDEADRRDWREASGDDVGDSYMYIVANAEARGLEEQEEYIHVLNILNRKNENWGNLLIEASAYLWDLFEKEDA